MIPENETIQMSSGQFIRFTHIKSYKLQSSECSSLQLTHSEGLVGGQHTVSGDQLQASAMVVQSDWRIYLIDKQAQGQHANYIHIKCNSLLLIPRVSLISVALFTKMRNEFSVLNCNSSSLNFICRF